MSGGDWSGFEPPRPPPPPAGTIVFSQAGQQARTGPPQLHPMTLGDILDGAFKLFKANARVLLTVTAVIVVPIQVLGSVLTVSAYSVDDLTSGADVTANVGAAVLGLASLLMTPFVTGPSAASWPPPSWASRCQPAPRCGPRGASCPPCWARGSWSTWWRGHW